MNFEISATSVRVFCGFRSAALTSEAFLSGVGGTFMPGTPFMLRDLGLASYTSGVLVRSDDRGPHEFALIGYATPDTWHSAMTDSLQGRMYQQTHAGYYDQGLSRASFPVSLRGEPQTNGPFYIGHEFVDWQIGAIDVFVGLRRPSTSVETFRNSVRGIDTLLGGGGYDCLICLPADDFLICWAHVVETNMNGIDWHPLEAICEAALCYVARRVAWRDASPPTQSLVESTVLNWIFVRDERHFLR